MVPTPRETKGSWTPKRVRHRDDLYVGVSRYYDRHEETLRLREVGETGRLINKEEVERSITKIYFDESLSKVVSR